MQIHHNRQAFGLGTAVRNGKFLEKSPDGQKLFYKFRNAGLNAANMVYGLPICMFGAHNEKEAYDKVLSGGEYQFQVTECNTRGNVKEIAKRVAQGATNVFIISGGFQAPRVGEHGNEFGVSIPTVPAEAIWLSVLNKEAEKKALAHMHRSFGASWLTKTFLGDFKEIANEIASDNWSGYSKTHFARFEGHVCDLQTEEKASPRRQTLTESILQQFGNCPLARRFVNELVGIADIRNGTYAPLTT